MKQSKATPETLARLKAALQRRGITQEQVAAEAAKTSKRRRASVSHTTVSNVLAGRRVSRNVVAAARRLLAAQSTNGKVGAA